MCGRYVVAYDPRTLVSGFSVTRVTPFPKRWNVTPQSPVPVVRQTKEGERVADLMRWGLLPHWAKDPALAAKLSNARADGVFDKPSFRQAARRRRCLLPASGFYEWQATATGKQPWYFSPTGGTDAPPLFAMAGLFEAWRPTDAKDEDEWLLTCCIITTDANATMAPVHDRMPVLLGREHWDLWLSREQQDPALLAPLLQPCAPELLQARPVARTVNRSSAEGETLIAPLD
ncbi:MAG: SOS response-associated peptidase [Rubrivivax sp.]|nr:SOS response-associated peptidase [Rubrivivax sp.]MDP3082959.1 SOS response-associated peptidase [Rubrivivax sp.]